MQGMGLVPRVAARRPVASEASCQQTRRGPSPYTLASVTRAVTRIAHSDAKLQRLLRLNHCAPSRWIAVNRVASDRS